MDTVPGCYPDGGNRTMCLPTIRSSSKRRSRNHCRPLMISIMLFDVAFKIGARPV